MNEISWVVWLFTLFIFIFCFATLRNASVLRVRLAFIDDTALYLGGKYDALPSYDAMYYNPRYWLLWTKKQWVKTV